MRPAAVAIDADRTPGFGSVAVVVAASGFCSLVYQVVWERTLRYSFGGDSISSAIVTGTFLLGLGIGAFAFRRWRPRALAGLAVVELLIGAYGIASYHVLASLARLLSGLQSGPVLAAEGVRPIVVVASILFLLPPCILIGGTGPLIFNCFIRPGAYTSAAVGRLYGWNTAGAAAGALATPFLFLNHLSLPAVVTLVGLANLTLAAVLWRWARQSAGVLAEDPEADATADVMPRRALLVLAFVSGFVSLGYEVTLFRRFFTINPLSPYNFPVVLTTFLLAMAVGSTLSTRLETDHPARWLQRVGRLFVAAMIGMLAGIVVSTTLSLPEFVRHSRPIGLAVSGALLILPLALLLSGVLPLLLRLAAERGRSLPRTTGLLYLVNAVGAFVGAMTVQFVGFPLLGTRGAVLLLFLIGVTAGSWCLMATAVGRPAVLRRGLLVPTMAAAALLVPGPIWERYTFGTSGLNVEPVEGISGTALIRWQGAGGAVFVNGYYMSALPDDWRHVQLVSFALALPRRERVLVLGLGGGGMVRELLRDPAVRQVDVVDWSRELPRLLESPRARALLADALQDSRVRLCRCDARVAVGLYPAGSFEIAIDNLAHANWVGATSVKSLAYFAQVRRVLGPTGVFVYKTNYATARAAILAGLTTAFPVVLEHEGGVVLASGDGVAISRERAEEVLAWRGRIIGITNPPYADWMLEGLRRISRDELGGAEPIRDDVLIYEYPRDPLRRLWPRG
jgi:spermidine synthase